uniref:Uncharacterized protein n=1 Tax=Lygus hesperus TaxID=30085 RepID=A0A146LHW7_LYGHE
MRRFRPRPLRQFDPLLAEREANAVKNEIRTLKHAVREDKKRVMRHVTAEATVQRRAQEKTASLIETQRHKQYNQLMGQLQAQQHTMKTVDTAMSKAKHKPLKGLSGAPKPSSTQDNNFSENGGQ